MWHKRAFYGKSISRVYSLTNTNYGNAGNGKLYANDYKLSADSVIKLKSNENTITFRFTSLGYESPELIKYEYMLEGKDSIWIELANEDKVSYFNLPAGNYVFRFVNF